jgi:ABC-type methionine transport system permease subunit
VTANVALTISAIAIVCRLPLKASLREVYEFAIEVETRAGIEESGVARAL